jgi:AbrB family looped-hinge helix DNA binding protein
MRTTIDRGGRVVIPKALREKAGLKPGSEVLIRCEEGTIEIRAPRQKGRLVRENGFLVWEPPPGTPVWTSEEIERARQEIRDEREDGIVRRAMGLDDDEDWS